MKTTLKPFSESISTGSISTGEEIFETTQFSNAHEAQLEYGRKKYVREMIEKNPKLGVYDLTRKIMKEEGEWKKWDFDVIYEDIQEIQEKKEKEEKAKIEKRIAEVAPKMIGPLQEYIKTKLDSYLIGEGPDSTSFHQLQSRAGVRLENLERQDFIRDRKYAILNTLNERIQTRFTGKEVPNLNSLKNELYPLIRKADFNFRIKHPIEEYWKRGKERMEKEAEKKRKEKPAKWRMESYISSEMKTNPSISDQDLAQKIARDTEWDYTQILVIIANLRKKEEKGLLEKPGIEEPPVLGLDSENNSPKGDYYHPAKGWY